jgi:hypothetical protein
MFYKSLRGTFKGMCAALRLIMYVGYVMPVKTGMTNELISIKTNAARMGFRGRVVKKINVIVVLRFTSF